MIGRSFNCLMLRLAEVNLRRWRWNELGGLDPDHDAAQVSARCRARYTLKARGREPTFWIEYTPTHGLYKGRDAAFWSCHAPLLRRFLPLDSPICQPYEQTMCRNDVHAGPEAETELSSWRKGHTALFGARTTSQGICWDD